MLISALAIGLALTITHNSPEPKPLHEIRLHPKWDRDIGSAAFFPDGKTVVFGGGPPLGPGELLFWDVKTGKPLHSHKEHKFRITSIAVSPNGKQVVTGGGYGQVKVWDPTGKVIADLDGGTEYTYGVVFSPDGKYLFHGDGALTIRETTNFKVLAEPHKSDGFGSLGAFFPDGKMFVGGSVLGELRFLSVPEWKETTYRTKVKDQEYYSPLCTPDGKKLVVDTMLRSSGYPFIYTTEVWSVMGSKVGEKRFEVSGHYLGRAITPNGKYLLLGEADAARGRKLKRIRVWDLGLGKEVISWDAGGSCIRCLVVSPDGNLLISCHDEGVARVWDLRKILNKQ